MKSILQTSATALLLASLCYACGGGDRTFVSGSSSGGSSGSGGAGGAGGKASSSSSSSSSGGSGGRMDGGGGTGGASGAGGSTDGGAGTPIDAGGDVDAGPPPPPPPPGRPGIAIVGGGTAMSSPSYKAVMATGEAPGANGVATSPKYKLHGGVIGTTQPK